MQIREGRAEDLPRLLEIYNHYVDQTPVTFDIAPLGLERRRQWFDGFATEGPHRLFVLEVGETVQGYASSGVFRSKPAYERSVETSIYLAPEAVSAGLGTALYQHLLDVLAAEPLVHRAYAGVTLPNEPSIALHVRCGFQAAGAFQRGRLQVRALLGRGLAGARALSRRVGASRPGLVSAAGLVTALGCGGEVPPEDVSATIVRPRSLRDEVGRARARGGAGNDRLRARDDLRGRLSGSTWRVARSGRCPSRSSGCIRSSPFRRDDSGARRRRRARRIRGSSALSALSRAARSGSSTIPTSAWRDATSSRSASAPRRSRDRLAGVHARRLPLGRAGRGRVRRCVGDGVPRLLGGRQAGGHRDLAPRAAERVHARSQDDALRARDRLAARGLGLRPRALARPQHVRGAESARGVACSTASHRRARSRWETPAIVDCVEEKRDYSSEGR